MGCRRRGGSTGGPEHLIGRLPHSDLERRLADGLLGRCHVLWGALYGAESDFDDLRGELARDLGWEDTGGYDLGEFLEVTAQVIEGCALPWNRLRERAAAVFDRVYGSAAVEVEAFDARTWDEAVNDTLFRFGRCRACELGISGSAREHRDLAGWVLRRRVTWEQIEEQVRSLTAPQPHPAAPHPQP